jgi:hypothetical protein
VEIFEPRPDLDPSDLHHIRAILNGVDANRQAAVDALKALTGPHSNDAALTNLIYRVEHGKAGEAYVLD